MLGLKGPNREEVKSLVNVCLPLKQLLQSLPALTCPQKLQGKASVFPGEMVLLGIRGGGGGGVGGGGANSLSPLLPTPKSWLHGDHVQCSYCFILQHCLHSYFRLVKGVSVWLLLCLIYGSCSSKSHVAFGYT